MGSRGRDPYTANTVIHAKKRFGQHFLEPAWAAKVLQAIGPGPEDTFLEIGPGTGALTAPLAAHARHLVAIEIDRDLAAALRDDSPPNVTVIESDVLDIEPNRLREVLPDTGDAGIRVAGNLPYNIGAPILFRLVDWLRAGLPLVDATVMLQREVADRLLAPVGSADYGVLTIGIRQYTTAERLLALPPGAFRPVPKVRSSIVRLRFHPPDPAVDDVASFRRMVQALFTRRRKTLANALQAFALSPTAASVALHAAGLDPGRRPQTLTSPELGRLFTAARSGVFPATGAG